MAWLATPARADSARRADIRVFIIVSFFRCRYGVNGDGFWPFRKLTDV
jgi:hypothetical protein